jgi:hypothetical protein
MFESRGCAMRRARIYYRNYLRRHPVAALLRNAAARRGGQLRAPAPKPLIIPSPKDGMPIRSQQGQNRAVDSLLSLRDDVHDASRTDLLQELPWAGAAAVWGGGGGGQVKRTGGALSSPSGEGITLNRCTPRRATPRARAQAPHHSLAKRWHAYAMLRCAPAHVRRAKRAAEGEGASSSAGAAC